MSKEFRFTDNELADAFRAEAGDIDPSASHIENLRERLLLQTILSPVLHEQNQRTSGHVTSASVATKQRLGLTIKLASIAAMIAILIIALRPLAGTAAADFRSALDATRHEAWIHTKTTVEYLGESNESESWCSPQQRIAAFRSPQLMHFVNYAEGVQWNYSERATAIYHWRADTNFENVGRTIVHALLTDGDLASAFPIHKVSKVEKSNIDFNGQSRVQYLFGLTLKHDAAIHSHAIVQVDRGSGRIVSWDETHAGGMQIVTKFDYPASGPRDIYELGADENAIVVDRVASSDVVELAEQFQHQVYNFGDYEALVIDQRQADDATPGGAPLFRRLWRSGKKFRVELLTAIEPDFNIPADADLSWWRANKTQLEATLLADCNGETCTLFAVDDPRLEIASEMSPRIKQQTTVPVLSVNNSTGSTTIPIWPSLWPEYACRPMLMTSDPTLHFDIDPAGTNGPPNTLRLRLLTPDSPFTKERASYWLSLNNDHCVIKSSFIQADFEGTTIAPVEKHVHYEYSNDDKSPAGITFATRRVVSESNGTRKRMTRYVVNFDVAK